MTFWILIALAVCFLAWAFMQAGAYAMDKHEERMAELGYVQNEDGTWRKVHNG